MPPTTIGRGAYGLSIRRRSYLDLARDPNAEAKPRLELTLGIPVTGWTVHAGSVYKATLAGADLYLAGAVRPVVGLLSDGSPRVLARVEQVGDVVAGTWFYDESAQSNGGSTEIYAQLAASNPSAQAMEALVLFGFGVEGEVVPVVGREKTLGGNNSLDSWSSSTDLDGWNEQNVGATGVVVTKETANVVEGTAALRIEAGSTGLLAGTNGGVNNLPHVLAAGADYLMSVAYWTSMDLHPDLSPRLRARNSTVGNTVAEDGVSQVASDAGCDLGRTYEEWLRALFVFKNPFGTTTSGNAGLRLHNSGGATAKGGYVLFDDFHFWRIHAYAYYAPRIAESSIPDQEVMAADELFGPKSMGSGGVRILDGDGEIAKALARGDQMGKPAFVYYAGDLPNGDEVFRDDWRCSFPALVRKPAQDDQAVDLALEDARTLTRAKALQAGYRTADLANLEPTDEGKPKPLLFGTNANPVVDAARVDVDGSTGYGSYEPLDPRVPVRDGVDVDLAAPKIRSYPSKEMADRDEGGVDITDATNDFNLLNNKTRYKVLRDIQVLGKDRTGATRAGTVKVFYFDTNLSGGVADKRVELDLAAPPYSVAASLQAAMRTAVGGGDTATTVVVSETTHKFTVARSGGKGVFINLYSNPAGGALLDKSEDGWTAIGYDGKNKAGGATASWTAEKPVFTSAENNHVLRFVAGGYKEGTPGKYTKNDAQPVDSYPAVASWLLQEVLGQPPETVDVAGTFKDARLACLSVDFTQLFWHVRRGDADVFKLLSICERGGVFDLVLEGRSDGSFLWRCKKYSSSTVGAVELYDRHYLDWESWLEPGLLYNEVRMYGDQWPALDRFMTWASAPTLDAGAMAVRHGVEGRVFEVEAALTRAVIAGGLTLPPGYYGRLIQSVPMVARTRVRGLLVNKLPGDKVIAWRSRAADPLGTLGMTPVAVATSTAAGDVITTSENHFLKQGQLVRISGHSGSTPDINGDSRVLTVTGAKTFTIATNITVGGTGGSLVRVPVFRIVGLKHDPTTGISDARLVDDVAIF